jgi:putative spermidine/putrescine transport system permease protein
MAKKTSLGLKLKRVGISTILVWIFGLLIFVFMALPMVVIVFSAFSPTDFPTFPPSGFSLHWFQEVISNEAWTETIQNSLLLMLMVTPITTILGTMASYSLHHLQFRGSELLQSFFLSPLMIPQIVLGIAMLYVFSAMGWNGSFLSLAIGQTLLAFPYVVRSVSASIAGVDPILEHASMSLGASQFSTLLHITLPLIRPGIIAGAVFAAVTSFGEVSVSLLLSAPTTTPVSVRIFNYIEQTFDPAVNAVSVLFILLSIAVLFIVERMVGLSKIV